MSELSCREFAEFLDDYLGGSQPETVRRTFEAHLDACPQCLDYLRTYEQTIYLTRKCCCCDSSEIPGDVPDSLVQAILQARQAVEE